MGLHFRKPTLSAVEGRIGNVGGIRETTKEIFTTTEYCTCLLPFSASFLKE